VYATKYENIAIEWCKNMRELIFINKLEAKMEFIMIKRVMGGIAYRDLCLYVEARVIFNVNNG
jgi:hypothetical protein